MAAPNPFARTIVHTGFNPPTPTKRKRRFPIVPVLMVVVLAGGGAVAADYVLNSSESRQEVVVQTQAFTFTLPETPTIQPLNQVVAGLEMAGSQWTTDNGSEALLVLAMDFGFALDEVTQQATFDAAVAGGAAEASGTVTSDSWVVTNGVYVRDTIVALPDGMMYMKSFGKGAWTVFLMGATAGSESPSGFADLVASFSFV